MSLRKEIKYSVLEVATVPAESSIHSVFMKSLDLARHVEELGYTRFWLAEHHNMISIASVSPTILISHNAGGTKKIRVGSGGVMLPNHSPLIVSEQFGTLGSLYPGRIDLGLGRAPGTDQVTAYAIRSDRMKSIQSFPDEIEQIKTYFSPANKTAPVRAMVAEGVNVPMYILGSSTDSAIVAAKLGLPYAFASHFAPALLLDALKIYYNNFQPSEVLSEPYSIACVNVIAADTTEEARRLSTSMIRMMLGILNDSRDYLRPPEEPKPELMNLLDHPSFQRMFKYAFIGDHEIVKQKTEAFLELTGVDEIMISSNFYHHEDRLKSFEIFKNVIKEINLVAQV